MAFNALTYHANFSHIFFLALVEWLSLASKTWRRVMQIAEYSMAVVVTRIFCSEIQRGIFEREILFRRSIFLEIDNDVC